MRGPNATYILPVHAGSVGACVDSRRATRWVFGDSHWVGEAFQIPTCWYQQRELLVLGSGPKEKLKREWFRVAVEYRLKN